MVQPRWMAEAWAEFGLTETPGHASNPRVLALFRDSGHPDIASDAVAWCAAFTGAVLRRSGHGSTGSLLARSYLEWGDSLDAPRPGAIAVFSRGADPGAGHVGFWIGDVGDQIMLLGGNQSGAVTVAPIARSRLLGLRWPRDADAGAVATGADAIFRQCLLHVLTMEGGYSDDPYDPGGPTNKGITLGVYARHIGAVVDTENRDRLVGRLRSIDDATVSTIYRRYYWSPSRAGEMPAAVALMHFDAAVNHGVLGAARLLQSVLGVDVDGEIGPVTMGAVQRAAPAALVAAYADARRERYRALPHFWRFGNGWLNRVRATEQLSATLLRTSATTREPPMTDTANPQPTSSAPTATPAKWWGESLTIWGALVTAISTVLPILGPILGLELTPDLIRKLGDQTLLAVQAIGGVVGTLMTILGRVRATVPLSRRNMTIQL